MPTRQTSILGVRQCKEQTMMLRIVAHLSLVVAVLVGSLSTMSTALGETLYQSNVDTRVVVALQVRPEAVQQWLSGPCQVNPVAPAPPNRSNPFPSLASQP